MVNRNLSNTLIYFSIFLLCSCGSPVQKRILKLSNQDVKEISSLTMKEHYQRNSLQKEGFFNKNSTFITEKDIKKNKKSWHSDGKAPTHNFNGAKDNVSYRGLKENKHIQLVFDKNGNLITDNENMPSYDYGVVFNDDRTINDAGLFTHTRKDVLPWILWGNTPDDKTSKKERFKSVEKTILIDSIKKAISL